MKAGITLVSLLLPLFLTWVRISSGVEAATTPQGVLALQEEDIVLSKEGLTTVPLETVGRFYISCGESLLQKGYTEAARYELGRVLTHFPREFPLCERATHSIAEAFVRDGNTTAAVVAWEQLVGQFAFDSSVAREFPAGMTCSYAARYYAFSARSRIYEEAGQYRKALEQLQQWVALLESEKDPFLGEFGRTATRYRTLNLWIPRQRTQIYFKARDYGNAVRTGEELLRGLPKMRFDDVAAEGKGADWKYSVDVDLRILVGDSYLALGNRASALSCYEEALAALKDPRRVDWSNLIPRTHLEATRLRDSILPQRIAACRQDVALAPVRGGSGRAPAAGCGCGCGDSATTGSAKALAAIAKPAAATAVTPATVAGSCCTTACVTTAVAGK